MRRVFADTSYWLAVANPKDQWALAASIATASIGDANIVTTEEVLAEFLDSYTRVSSAVRRQAAEIVRQILADPTVVVVAQSHESFLAGLQLYERRLDQGYSLTDCVSMNCMRARKISDALTSDQHFAVEGLRSCSPSRKRQATPQLLLSRE